MKLCIVGGVVAVLLAGGLIASAPPASAGCQYGGPVISKCDGPVQPDGTWQRCIGVYSYVPSGLSSHLVPVKRCDLMGPGHDYPGDFVFADPPVHIND
ncbi:hypothetical protein MMAG44476_15330 [Mycolicibacterium mageritense DSM 44476 = CIP 104973]|uniref:CDGP domain-containing protein n=1 Tax=Mycolicibacterium mageritense TaxID=53462 RepID=A0AAI8TRJ1_MYCME|nr:hypothetical protein [Mycolicibacterium mageritense]MCC9186505.1 hypothetical protein [Mycolicibacterium mageritense]TXI58861.1 MAG: hypothetical protein E6Q55_22875 [Mycolicibacterium mageritense]CDO22266.1 hypothetical protein BN978_02736 [Mycolicibacterium mageritense DSM 44476 = CIP 104973]BBX33842.1 hypothetical protein MMAGJ_31240 [Mycolicibacterium mageritense]BDY27629.1 hypothetical protein hbim_01554 [Mycolicibacterium mageritense]